jgi:hypothetical protein
MLGKGNPMKDHARQFQAPLGAAALLYPDPGIPPRRLRSQSKNAYKNPYKCDRFADVNSLIVLHQRLTTLIR